MDMDLTLMIAFNTAIEYMLKPAEGFDKLSREKQAELVWEYTNLVFKYPKSDSFFNFWREAAMCDVREALTEKTTSERSIR